MLGPPLVRSSMCLLWPCAAARLLASVDCPHAAMRGVAPSTTSWAFGKQSRKPRLTASTLTGFRLATSTLHGDDRPEVVQLLGRAMTLCVQARVVDETVTGCGPGPQPQQPATAKQHLCVRDLPTLPDGACWMD